ncbi:LysE family translocator [Prauserella flavalba]|uniref:Lysine transporter LysE n=1 Tax=Prauserella flavalba TaxID=1477506 RepID=A0A318LKC8_9PSEU|nr:LysE family translocator [Prauserella flavalba]PXY33888.1 lysine transporter LysE [Prauserella flavalba]
MNAAFLLNSLVVAAIPGTGAIYTLSAGVSRGGRAGLVAAFGCTLGVVPHIVATLTGLAALLHTSALAFEVLRYLGVAYLLYLAVATLRDKRALVVREQAPRESAAKVITSAVLINVLNPKLTIFFVAFLPQFVSPDDPRSLPTLLELSGIFMLMTFLVFAAYGLCAAAVRDQVISRPRVLTWTRRVFAGSFAGLATSLALTDR